MLRHVALARELMPAHGAGVGALARVYVDVCTQVMLATKRLFADVTCEWLLTTVYQHVTFQLEAVQTSREIEGQRNKQRGRGTDREIEGQKNRQRGRGTDRDRTTDRQTER